MVMIACDDIIEVEDISNESVVLLAPINEAVLDTLGTTFTWEPLAFADSYLLQVATPSFESASKIVIDTTITKTSFSKLLKVNAYQWRVRAENSGYHTDYSKQSFSVEK
ncbi:hypothetical protein GCM10022395_01830 [Snuella lapsa]|uniref:Fibronectin type-III domain-containing protein n=2 Tax=Snuella lapsa TaxID=870481 RepID=A0ABP6WPI3_9FLAO